MNASDFFESAMPEGHSGWVTEMKCVLCDYHHQCWSGYKTEDLMNHLTLMHTIEERQQYAEKRRKAYEQWVNSLKGEKP